MDGILDKKQVIKHSAIIQIEHRRVSLAQQKVWNILLSNAFPGLEETGKTFQISMRTLDRLIEAKNKDYLKSILKKLVGTTVACNIFGKDNQNTWQCFTLLSGAKIENDVCYYRYDAELQRLINNPSIYTKINLLIQQNYKGGKHGWFLYELCFDYRDIGQTPWMSLEDAKKFFGVSEKKAYKEYKYFNKMVLKPALKEANSQTDLNIELKIKKTGRKVAHLQFVIQIKDDHKKKKSQASKKIEFKDEVLPEVVEALDALCVSKAGIREITKKHAAARIMEAVEAVKEYRDTLRKKGEELRHPDKAVEMALEKGWQSQTSQKAREGKEGWKKQDERFEDAKTWERIQEEALKQRMKKFEEQEAAEKLETEQLQKQFEQDAKEYRETDFQEKFDRIWRRLPQEHLESLPAETIETLRKTMEDPLLSCDTFEQAFERCSALLPATREKLQTEQARDRAFDKIQKIFD